MLFSCDTSEPTWYFAFNITYSFCVFDFVIGLIRCGSEVESLKQKIQVAEEGLSCQVKAGISISECTNTEPLQNLQNTNQITEPNNDVSLEASHDAEHIVR